MMAIITGSLLALRAYGASPVDLDPLLRAMSVRPWWGDPPPIALTGLDGRRYSLDPRSGHATILYFWATW
jgi:hypothetical protein